MLPSSGADPGFEKGGANKFRSQNSRKMDGHTYFWFTTWVLIMARRQLTLVSMMKKCSSVVCGKTAPCGGEPSTSELSSALPVCDPTTLTVSEGDLPDECIAPGSASVETEACTEVHTVSETLLKVAISQSRTLTASVVRYL